MEQNRITFEAAPNNRMQMPYDAFWGARYAVIRDPEGNSVGLESPLDEGKRSWPPVQSPDPKPFVASEVRQAAAGARRCTQTLLPPEYRLNQIGVQE